MFTMDMLDDDGRPGPKRGDLMQTNVGTGRERTWIILRARHMKRAKRPRRYQVLAARWWELEPEMRVRLFLSAERNGGQRVIWFDRYPVKKKQTFEQHMARKPVDNILW